MNGWTLAVALRGYEMPEAVAEGPTSAHQNVVLLVDDEVELLEVLRATLEPKGFDVVTASNPFTAVRLAATCEPDVIVLDLDMPGMDGLEAARHLKRIEQTRRIPIIAFTGRSMRSIDSVQRSAFDSVIEKAGGLEPLETQIEDLIGYACREGSMRASASSPARNRARRVCT